MAIARPLQVGMKIVADQALKGSLRKLDTHFRAPAHKRAGDAGALVMVEGMRIRVPYESGNLLHSINASGGIGMLAPTTGAALPPPIVTDRGSTHLAGSLTEYSRAQEYGFTGFDSLGRYQDYPGTPYVRPMLDEDGNKVLNAVAKSYRDTLVRAVP